MRCKRIDIEALAGQKFTSIFHVIDPRRFHFCVRESGARKVFFASAAPPVRFPNVYGIDMPASNELVAAGRSDEEVSRLIGADWLVYQDLEDLVAACQHDNAKIVEFDTSCFSGQYVTGDVTSEYLDRLQRSRSDAAQSRRRPSSRSPLKVVGSD